MREDHAFRFGPFYFDSSDLLFRDGQRVPLEPIQARVLRALLYASGRVVTKAELIERAWRVANVSDESISRAIYCLRKSLGQQRDRFIEVISSKGYRLACRAVREPAPSPELTGARSEDVSLADSPTATAIFKTARALTVDYDAMLGYWDMDLRCQYANSAYEIWFGRSQANMRGISMSELLGPLFHLNFPYIQGARRGDAQNFKRRITLPNGIVRASLASYFPDFRNGKVVGFSVLVLDAERFESHRP